MTEPVGPTAIPKPLLRNLRDVVTTAGLVAQLIADDPTVMIARLCEVDPRLAEVAGQMTDAVYELDYRTNYLGGPPAPVAY